MEPWQASQQRQDCSANESQTTIASIMGIQWITGPYHGLLPCIIKGLSLQEHKLAAKVFRLKLKPYSNKLYKCGKAHLEKITLILWQHRTVWPGCTTTAIVIELLPKHFGTSFGNDKPCLDLDTLLLPSQQPTWHGPLPNSGANQMPKIFILLLCKYMIK